MHSDSRGFHLENRDFQGECRDFPSLIETFLRLVEIKGRKDSTRRGKIASIVFFKNSHKSSNNNQNKWQKQRFLPENRQNRNFMNFDPRKNGHL
jgi:hypothetical protein